MALRKVIIVCVIAVGAAFLISFYFIIDPLMKWITAPIEARGVQVIYTAVSEALTTELKVDVVTAVVIAFPVIIWQLWSFIKPALYPKEQRTFRVFFFFALLLFLIGIVFCYASVFFLATFGVYVSCNISIIRSICALLARGSLISAAVIVLCLPSVLVLCEGVINKTSLHWRTSQSKKELKKS